MCSSAPTWYGQKTCCNISGDGFSPSHHLRENYTSTILDIFSLNLPSGRYTSFFYLLSKQPNGATFELDTNSLHTSKLFLIVKEAVQKRNQK